MLGRTLLHYQVLEKLGEGGMGVVYKARDTHLDRFVAIKVLPPEKLADPQRRARFVQEAKAASALNHPHIVHIYDISQAEGVDFIAMEYVAGSTLDHLIPRKGLRLNETLQYAVQIADALARAHAAGIIHRDLKPSNVMADDHGVVKLLDFGLAKLAEPAGPDDETVTLGVKTEEGAIVGTSAYMSPEQAQGKAIDTRSDIFSFGSLLYEMATGQPAFRGETRISTLAAILEKDPAALPADTPYDLKKVISRCLRKDSARRFQTMADLKVALEEIKEESDSGRLAGPTPARARRRTWQWAAAAALVAVAGAATWYALSLRQASAPAMNLVPLTSFPGYEREPSFSPDGNQVAFTWNGDKQDNFDIYVMLAGGGKPLRLSSDPAEDSSPAWSPDGRSIAFLRSLPGGKAAVLLVPPLGGPERKIAEVYDRTRGWMAGPCLAWHPNGDSLAVIDKSSPNEAAGLFLLSVETGAKTRLTSPSSETPYGDNGLAFSPDGASLAFNRVSGLYISDLFVLALTSQGKPAGEPRRLTFGNWNATGPVWPGPSDIVFSSSRRGKDGLWRISRSGTGAPARLPVAAEEPLTVAIAPHAKRLIYSRSTDDVNLWRVELPGGRISGPISSSTRNENHPNVSPDGKRVAFVSNRSGTSEIWLADADGSNLQQLTLTGASVSSTPRWSPDGQWIAFGTNQEGQYEDYVLPAGGGKPQRLTDHPAMDGWTSWSRDGKWIYFNSTRGGWFEIWKAPFVPGGAPPPATQVTRNGGSGPRVSPDGKWLYYGKTEPVTGLWRMPLAGGEETRVLETIASNSYEVFSDGIYYVKPSGASSVLEFLDLSTGKVTMIARTEKPASGLAALGLAIAPDRRWALFAQRDREGSDLMLVENFR